MEWRHEINPDYFEAMKNCITATDIVKLIPELEKAKELFSVEPGIPLTYVIDGMSDTEIAEKLDVTSFPMTLGLLADLLTGEKDLDAMATGAAARRHILKRDFFKRCPEVWKHWDDIVVTRELPGGNLNLGFSPDGFFDISQDDIIPEDKCKVAAENLTVYAMEHDIKINPIEVKAYDPKRYLKAIMTPKEDLTERYELAMAGCVIGWEHIDRVTLVFYCPEFYNIPEGLDTEDGKHYDPIPVVPFSYTLKELIEESKLVYDACGLLVCIANTVALKGIELNEQRGWLFDLESNQRDWATIEEIHDAWEQEQSRETG